MILSCPECGTQYTLKESQLGPRGRTVRCVACKHTWHAEVPIDLRFSEPRPEKPEPVEDLQSVKAKKLPGKYRAMLEDKKRMRALAVETAMWGGMAALVLVVLALGYFLRVDVVKAFPRISGAYAMVGLKVSPTDLKIVSTSADKRLMGGRFGVTVKVQVENTSGTAAPVPPVRVTLLDASLQQFNTVLIGGDLKVEPHATRTLTFDVADASNLTSSIDVKFDFEAMKKGQKNQPEPKPAAPGGEHHGLAAGSEEDTHETDAAAAPETAEAHPADAHPAEAHPAEALIDPPATDAQDSDIGSQTIETDTGVPPHSLSRKPAHPLRGALSFSDGTAAPKAGKTHTESQS